MSLPRVVVAGSDPQLEACFAPNAAVPRVVREQGAFFVFFARTIYPALAAQRPALAQMYTADDGRAPYDPVRLVGVQMLQTCDRLSDRAAATALEYDRRWRLALHLQAHEHTFDPSLLPRFRQRLVAHALTRLAFEAVVELLVEGGWIPPGGPQRIDSTPVHGLLAHLTRLGCVRASIRLFLQEVRRTEDLSEPAATWWQRYGVEKVAARSTPPQLEALSLQAGRDLHHLLDWAPTRSLAPKAAQYLRLLRRVFEENYEPDAQGGYRQRPAQPPGAIHTPYEPEAEWSSKSTLKGKDKSWVGTKLTQAETVVAPRRQRGEPTCCFLTAMVTQRATESDKAGMAQVFAEQHNMGLAKPQVLYGDGAYISAEGLHEAQCEGRELLGPAPASPDRGQVYTVEAFDVQVEERSALCPAGHRSRQCSRLQEAASGKVTFRLEWNIAQCGPCAQFAACVSPPQRHRTLVVGEHHTLLQQRRRDMQTEAFQRQMHHRNAIEGTGSELVRGYDLRHARYRGVAKVRLQNYFIGAACNVHRLFRRLLWEQRQGRRRDLSPICLPTAATPPPNPERSTPTPLISPPPPPVHR
jgi:hypothetical protein